MKIKYSIYTAIGLIALTFACRKVDNGFLSDTIRYKDKVVNAKRGMPLTLSDRINADGSTPPFQFKMINLRNKATGAPAPEEFFKEYEIITFKPGMSFNAATDTTVELLNAKRETVIKPPMEFNPISGQIAFNRASANLPLGEFEFDLEASNRWGTKFYPSFAQINVIEPTVDDVFEVTYQAASASNDAEVFTTLKAPVVTCTKISNDGARVILKIVDKNGVPFNPKAGQVISRGDRPTFESHVKFNPIVKTDQGLICDFEIAPFPMVKYITPTTDWGYLIYYRIPKQFIEIDGLPNQNANPVFGFRIKMEGTYEVEVKMRDALKK